MPDPNPASGPRDEFLELVIRSFEPDVTSDELRQLNEQLRRDPACRERYVEYCLHAQMIRKACSQDSAAAEISESARTTPRTTRRRRVAGGGSTLGSWQLALTAAGVLLGLAVLVLLVSSPEEERSTARSVRPQIKETAPKAPVPPEPRPGVEPVEPRKQDVPPAPPKRDDGLKKQKDAEELQREKERIERELRESVKVVQKPVAEPEKPRPTPEPRQEKPEVQTRAALAQIEEVAGDVLLATKEAKTAAKAGDPLRAGQAIHTGTGRAVIRFADKTRVELDADTVIDEIKTDAGKWIFVARGRVFAEVARQPKDQPMIFASPYGEAKVLGTTLRLFVDPKDKGSVRLDVEEGKVELKRLFDQKAVLVESGHFAVAASGVELKATALPIEEIILLPPTDERKLKMVGTEWRLVKSAKSPNGVALESVSTTRLTGTIMQIPAYVTMTFEADAGRDYYVWIRGESLGTTSPLRLSQDAVLLQFGRSEVTPRHRTGVGFSTGPDGGLFGGWGYFPGRSWVGGDGDYFSAAGARLPDDRSPTAVRGDEPPTIVRFARPGTQILKLCLAEGPVRVDAILLSTTQKTRPAVDRIDPVKK